MKIYFYCSYKNSKRGFFLTRLTKDGLIPANLFQAKDIKDQFIYDFFTYDNFRVIWKEFSEDSKRQLLFPKQTGSVFGIRGLKGKISDHDGIINVAFLAKKDELDLLEKIVQGILNDMRMFSNELFRCMSIGGSFGYEVHKVEFMRLLENIQKETEQEKQKKYSERDLLRFAVYIGSWERASEKLLPKFLWKICPKSAISEEEFKKEYDIEGLF